MLLLVSSVCAVFVLFYGLHDFVRKGGNGGNVLSNGYQMLQTSSNVYRKVLGIPLHSCFNAITISKDSLCTSIRVWIYRYYLPFEMFSEWTRHLI